MDRKITELPVATTIDGMIIIPIVQDGVTKQMAASNATAGLVAAIFPPVQTHGNTGADETFHATTPVHTATLTADCVFTFDAATPWRYELTLILTQDGTGGRLVTWPASVKWPSGIAPVLSSGINKVDVFTFVSPNEGVTWYGFFAGADLR